MRAFISLLCAWCWNVLCTEGGFKVGDKVPFNLVAPPFSYVLAADKDCNLKFISPEFDFLSGEQFKLTFTKLIRDTVATGDRTVYYVLRLQQKPCDDYYIARDATTKSLPKMFDLAQADDSMLWELTPCVHSANQSYVAVSSTFNYQLSDSRTYYLGANDGKLQVFNSKSAECSTSGFIAYIYPNGALKQDQCVSEIIEDINISMGYLTRRKRRTTASLGRLLRLTVQAGEHKYLVARKRKADGTFSDGLSLSTFCQECLSKDSLFYYEGYRINRIDSWSGLPIMEEGFTLLHAISMQFLTTDVSANMDLNFKHGVKTGLKFQNADSFIDDSLLDYRHFVVQKRQENYGKLVVYVCPVHHRRFCLLPTNSGSVTLYPVNESQANHLQPSIQAPFNSIFSSSSKMVADWLGSNTSLPSFGVFERLPVAVIGPPEIVYISVYTGYDGKKDANETSSFGSYDRVLSYDQSVDRLVFTTWDEAFKSPFRILRQRWSEPGSSAVYISLQVADNSSDVAKSYRRRYITRSSVVPVLLTSTFGNVDTDNRLFNTKCCFCSRNVTDVSWIYFNSGGSSVVSLAATPNMTVTLKETSLPSNPICQEYALRIRT